MSEKISENFNLIVNVFTVDVFLFCLADFSNSVDDNTPYSTGKCN